MSFIDKLNSSISSAQAKIDFDTDIQSARVEYVVTERDDICTPSSATLNSLRKGTPVANLNSIYVTFAYTSKHIQHSGYSKIWVGPIKPLMRTFTDTPTRGDDVCIIWVEDVAYYLGPLNSNNSVQYNPNRTVESKIIKGATSGMVGGKIKGKDLQGIPKNIKYTSLARLEKPYDETLDYPIKHQGNDNSYDLATEIDLTQNGGKMNHQQYIRTFGTPGDTYIEGKFGNSIRLGSRNSGPVTFISNLRQKEGETDNSNASLETPYDGVIVGMLSEFNIQDSFLLPKPWEPSCNGPNNKEFPVTYEPKYEGNQLFISSDKIIIDSRPGQGRNSFDNGLLLSSFNDIELGTAENLNIHTAKSTVIDSKNIFLGKNAENKKNPLVLGKELSDLLEKIIDAIGNLSVGGTIGGMSAPVKGSPAYAGLEKIKNEFKEILSTKHFIEEN